jgi:predicted Zn-dependent protease
MEAWLNAAAQTVQIWANLFPFAYVVGRGDEDVDVPTVFHSSQQSVPWARTTSEASYAPVAPDGGLGLPVKV